MDGNIGAIVDSLITHSRPRGLKKPSLGRRGVVNGNPDGPDRDNRPGLTSDAA